MKFLRVVLVLLSTYSVCYGFAVFGPIIVGVTSIVTAAICRFRECCDSSSILANFTALETTLKKHIYGQHLVQDIVLNALRSHWDEGNNKPQKALTLSFHGWPGSGKNYVSKFIIETLYKEGSKSKFVHQFVGRIHFPEASKMVQYQQDLYSWIKGNVSKCGKQLFLFDEVDKMPAGVLNSIKPMIDYRDDIDGVDYRQSIFIFLSNTGAELINEHFLELWANSGIKREDLKLKHFEKLIALGAFNEEGGFHHSDTIKSNLIDHYVPFLPMERHHVKMCIIDEFNQRNFTSPGEQHISEAMEFIEWGPSSSPLFSKTGCKRLSQKVGVIVSKHKSKL